MKHILLISTWYPSDEQPALGTFVEEQAVALRQKYRITVIAPRQGGWRDRLRGEAGRVRVEQRRGIDVVRVRSLSAIPRFGPAAYAAYLGAALRAYKFAAGRAGRPDLIHAHVVRPAGWAAVHIGRRESLPVVLTEHSGPFSMHLRSAIDRRHAAWTLGEADAVVAVSPSLRLAIRSFIPVDVSVVGNTIDTSFFSLREPTISRGNAFRVLTVSVLVASKRVDQVLEAVALLARQMDRPVELTIVGDGPLRESLENRASKLGLRDRCRFLGLMGREGVRDEIRRCDAFVLASEAETFGIVIAEAMASGAPVVSTRSGGPEFIVEPGTGVLVSVGDVDGMAGALRDIATGARVPDLHAARESVTRRFGRSAFVEAISAVYERALSKGRSTGE